MKETVDRIWISLPVEEDEMYFIPGIWSEKLIENSVDIGPFILSTPVCEHAGEIVDKIKVMWNPDTSPIDWAVAKVQLECILAVIKQEQNET